MANGRPVAYLAVRDDVHGRAIGTMLRDRGWAVREARDGLDLVGELSGLILGDAPSSEVDLIVVDDALPGCRGRSIERGLRDLGIDVPVWVLDQARGFHGHPVHDDRSDRPAA
jgi:DNA-binding response OmpR family regulator